MQINLTELVNQAQNGDRGACSKLYQITFKDAYYLALRITGNEKDALKAVEESYKKAFSSISALKTPESFEAWIRHIVSAKSIELVKRNNPSAFVEGAVSSTDVVADGYEFLPKGLDKAANAGKAINKIIDSLSAEQRTVAMLHYFNEMPVSHIARMLGCAEGNVESELASARGKIKSRIERMINRETYVYPAEGQPVLSVILKASSQEQIVDETMLKGIFASATEGMFVVPVMQKAPESNYFSQEPQAVRTPRADLKENEMPKTEKKKTALTSKQKITAIVCAAVALVLVVVGALVLPKIISPNNDSDEGITQQTVPEISNELIEAVSPYSANYGDSLKACFNEFQQMRVEYNYIYEDLGFVVEYVDANDIPDLVMFGKNYYDESKTEGNNSAIVILNGNYSDLTESDVCFDILDIEEDSFWIGKKGHFVTKYVHNDESAPDYELDYREYTFLENIEEQERTAVLRFDRWFNQETNTSEEHWIYSDRTMTEPLEFNGWDEFNKKKEEFLKDYYQLDSGYSVEEFVNSGKDFVDFLKDAKIKYFGFAKSQEDEATTALAESTTLATVTVDVKWKESAVLNSYSSIEYYSEKTSVIKMADTGYYGLVDAKGNVVIQPAASQYFEHCSYGNGNIHYLLSPTDGGEGYEINMSTYKVATEIHGGHGANEDTIPEGYDDIDRYFNGLAAVKKNGKWGYIDKSKNVVIPIEYEEVQKSFMTDNCRSFDGKYIPVKKNGKMGIIDKQNQIVVPFEYDVIMQGEDGVFIAKRNGRWGFIGIGVEPKEPKKAVSAQKTPEWEQNYLKELKSGEFDSYEFILTSIDDNDIPDMILIMHRGRGALTYYFMNGDTEHEDGAHDSIDEVYFDKYGNMQGRYYYNGTNDYNESYNFYTAHHGEVVLESWVECDITYADSSKTQIVNEVYTYRNVSDDYEESISKESYEENVKSIQEYYTLAKATKVEDFLQSGDSLSNYYVNYRTA